MKIEVHPDLHALDEARWNGLLDRARLPSVFLTWQWQTAWVEAFATDRPKQILAVIDGAGGLAGLLPLYEDAPGRQRIVGGVDVSDYLDLIAPDGREEEVWAALLQHCATQPAEWDLHGIRAASATATLVLGHLSEHNNHPEIVRLMADQALRRRGLETRLAIAGRAEPTEVFTF